MEILKGFNQNEIKSSISPERFHLIIFPTEQCNFRCTYCYEDFSIGKMPDWVVDATKTLLKRKIPNLSLLNIGWFGGEPLMAKDVMLDLAQFAFELCEQHGCRLTGDITTNAALLDVKTLKRLVELKQSRFQISIDGAKDKHDTTRLTRTGRGSFDKIWGRLMDAAETDLEFHITLRIHVTAFNQDSVEEFCQMYTEHLAGDKRFTLFFKAIENLGGEQQGLLQELTNAGHPRKVAAALQEKYQAKPKGSNYICYASKPNSLAIRANGSLNKCTVALQDDVNHIGKINPDGTLQINNQKFSTWTQGFTSLDSWTMGCPLSSIEEQKKKKPVYSSDIKITEVA